jgi:hypothetical protein
MNHIITLESHIYTDYWFLALKLLIFESEVRWKMLDAYIIEKIKKERERKEEHAWQPIPLPLENPNLGNLDPAKKNEKERKAEVVIRF